MRKQLVSWQWQAYPDNHTTRTNLAIHIVTNPLFILGVATLIAGPLIGPWWLSLCGLGGMLIGLVGQGRGHKLEAAAPIAFTGPDDFVSRFFVEQFVNFPRFVLSGGWLHAWKASR
jgi:hypothetical protein